MSLALPQVALSQQTPEPAPAASKDTTQLETIEVTGSRIKRSQAEGPTPVTIINRDTIEKLGYTSVRDILGNMSYNAGGTFDAGQSFSFARGSQSIDLRGFGAGRTLILLDGRRLPVFPQGLGGTNAFVDLSTIPASIVERVEVLLDGASAIYGSDAISGVVNIITRKNYVGSEASMYASGTQGGGGASQRYQALDGFVAGDSTFMMVGEYTHQNVLKFTDRDYSSSDFNHGGNGSSFGSNFVDDNGAITKDPNCAATLGFGAHDTATRCRFDRSKFREWVPESDKGSLWLRATKKIMDLDGAVRIGYSRFSQSVNLEPNPFSGGESGAFTSSRIYPNSAFDPVNGPGYVQDGAPNDPNPGDGVGGFFNRRLVEFGPRGQQMTTEAFMGLMSLGGSFLDGFTWEVGLQHNESRLTALTPTILSSVFDNEVSNNGLDLFQPIPASVIAIAKHNETESGASKNTGLDATVTGPVGLQLPGGMTQFAVHADYVREVYYDQFDAITSNGDVFDGNNGGGGRRRYSALGAEIRLPILTELEAGLSARYDRYVDPAKTRGRLSPMANLGYRPISDVLLRASAGRSFRAPDLQRLFGATSAGFSTVTDTVLCQQSGGTNGNPTTANPSDPCLPIKSVPAVTGSDPNLTEERGRNFNLGASWDAFSGFNVQADYFNIKVDHLVGNLSAQAILDQCANNGSFCGQIQRDPNTIDPITGQPALGDPATGGSNRALISAGALNIASQEAHGIDLSTSYLYRLGSFGQFKHELSWSRLTSVKVQSLPGAPTIQQLNNADTVILPRDRQNFTTDWSMLPFGVTLRIDRVGKYPGTQSAANAVQPGDFVKPFTTVGLQARVEMIKWGTVRLGVQNLFNEDFSIDPTFTPGTPGVQNQYITSFTDFYSSPWGRVGYVQYEFHF